MALWECIMDNIPVIFSKKQFSGWKNDTKKFYPIKRSSFLFLPFVKSVLFIAAFICLSFSAMADSNTYTLTSSFEQFKKDHNKLEIIKIFEHGQALDL